MGIDLHYRVMEDLPKLGWIADIEGKKAEIYHGSHIECHENFMVEGIWDSEFQEGNFTESENFFGSGIRIRNNTIYLVPSSASVDRELYCHYKKRSP